MPYPKVLSFFFFSFPTKWNLVGFPVTCPWKIPPTECEPILIIKVERATHDEEGIDTGPGFRVDFEIQLRLTSFFPPCPYVGSIKPRTV